MLFWSRKRSDLPASTPTGQQALPAPPEPVTWFPQDDSANPPPVPSQIHVPPSIPAAATQANINEVTRTDHRPDISSESSSAVPLPSTPKLRAVDSETSPNQPMLTVPQKFLSQSEIASEQPQGRKNSGQQWPSPTHGGESDDEQCHDASEEDERNVSN